MKEEEKKILYSVIPGLILVGLMWIVHLIAFVSALNFASWGLYPLRFSGLLGIVTSPFLHGDFNHLISNSLPLFILLSLVFYTYPESAKPLLIWLFVATGFWTWCFARQAYHIGASGLVYGYVSFVFFSGVFKKNKEAIAFSLLMVFLYGGLLLGLIPQENHISWEGHLSGFVAGGVYAYIFREWDQVSEDESSFYHLEALVEEDEITLTHIYRFKEKKGKWKKIKIQ